MSKARKMLYVEWDDSVAMGKGRVWLDQSEAIARDMKCYTVGFVIHEDRKALTLAGSWGEFEVSGNITIPRAAITKRRVVRVKR